MATSVVVTCRVAVHDCRVYIVLVRLQRFTPSEEFFSQELLVCISCCLGCTYRYMGNRLLFLNFSSKAGLVSAVMFETCSVLSLSSVEVPHIRFKFKDVRLNKPFNWFRESSSIFAVLSPLLHQYGQYPCSTIAHERPGPVPRGHPCGTERSSENLRYRKLGC